MNIFVRIGRLILTFAIFIVAQALLAASINSMFELVPIKIDRIFPKDKSSGSVTETTSGDSAAITDDASLIGRMEADLNRVREDLRRREIQQRKEKHTVPTMLTGAMTSSAVMDTTGVASNSQSAVLANVNRV